MTTQFQAPELPNLAINGSNFRIGSSGYNNNTVPNSIGFQNTPESRPNQINTGFTGLPAIPGNNGNIPGQLGLTAPDALNGAGDINFFDAKGGSRFLVPGLEALTGIGNAYLAKQQLDLGRDQFNFAQDTNIRDFNSQAQSYNTNLENAKRNNLAANGTFDTSTPEGQAQFDSALDAYVKENSIQNA